MTDTAPTTDPPDEPPAKAPVPPGVQERLDKIHAERLAREAAEEAAEEAEDKRVSDMDAARAICAAACGPINDALFQMDEAGDVDPEERAAVVAYLAETHVAHAGALEAAYLAFSGQKEGESNPAVPGAEAPLTSNQQSSQDIPAA
jgi:hypothetical protein